MTDYTKLVKALRCCAGANTKPTKCPDYGDYWCGGECLDKHLIIAADAIEELQDTVQAQDKALKECARQLAKMGPKRGVKKNADIIRAMTDEELAEWVTSEGRYFGEEYEGYMSCLDWLQEEVQDG